MPATDSAPAVGGGLKRQLFTAATRSFTEKSEGRYRSGSTSTFVQSDHGYALYSGCRRRFRAAIPIRLTKSRRSTERTSPTHSDLAETLLS
jgi:hypothetical protein